MREKGLLAHYFRVRSNGCDGFRSMSLPAPLPNRRQCRRHRRR